MDFKLISDYKPQGDQGRAIESLLRGVFDREQHQVLLGVTGSGKTDRADLTHPVDGTLDPWAGISGLGSNGRQVMSE